MKELSALTQIGWKRKIKKCCKDAGTYQPIFEPVIDTLASIMAHRDDAVDRYAKTGSNPIVKHTNKGGSTNLAKNPALVLICDLNNQALTYWRELGLTPAGLKKLNEQAIKVEGKKSALESALDALGK